MTNNNIGKDVPIGTSTSYTTNPLRPSTYTPAQPPHLTQSGPNLHPPASTQPDSSAQRYMPSVNPTQPPTSSSYNYVMPSQHGIPVGGPSLPPIHGGPAGGASATYMRYPGSNAAPSQYGPVEASGMAPMGADADHAKIGSAPSIPATGPLQNGSIPSQSLIQMLSGGAFPKSSAPASGIEGNIIMPTQDQMLIQGPIVLNQLNSVAEFLAAKGDFNNAIKYYERITSLDPENGAAWTALGHCYLLTDDLQKAFTSYQKALYSLPDVRDPQLWYGIGLLYDKFETYEYAIPTLMSVLKLAPNFAQKSEVLYKLAVIFGKTYQLDQAINYFKLATLESSGAPAVNRRIDILIKMGICYIEKKEYADALRSYEAALAMNDQNCRTLQHIAWCEYLMGKHVPALEHINRAISLKESDGDGYYIKGRILLATEKYPEAKEAFNRAVLHNQSRAVYLASLGVVNCLTKLYNEAFENFLKATQLDQSIPEVWFDIGILYEIHQQFTEAVIAYQKAIEVAPDFTEAINRKQALSTEMGAKSPLPQFLHPEFRVADPMVPLKSFINNQKVKKASEPCLNNQLPAQPPNLISTIFNSIGLPSTAPTARAGLPQLGEPGVLPVPGMGRASEDNKMPLPQNHIDGAPHNHGHPHEEAKAPPKEERRPEEHAYEHRPSEHHHETHQMPLLHFPQEKEPPKPVSAPEAPVSRPSQSVPRIPIPDQSEPEMHHPFQMPNLSHPSVGPQSSHMPSAPKVHKPTPAPTEMSHPQYATQPQGAAGPSMPSGSLNPQMHGPQMQQIGLLSQLAQLQQQQSQLQAMLSSFGLMPQAANAYMQMLGSVQGPMMPGKMPFVQTPTFGGPSVQGMARPMQQMMGSTDIGGQYGQFSSAMPRSGMLGGMPLYGPQSAPQMHRPDNPPPAASYPAPTSRPSYISSEPPHQYAPPAEAPQSIPKSQEPPHPTGVTPTKPIPQHPKTTPGKLPARISPISKRGAGLEDLIKVAVGTEKKPGSKPVGLQKPHVVSIAFTGQHQGEEYGEERKQGESNTLVKLAMSPQRVDEEAYGKRRRPEMDVNREMAAERDQFIAQNKKPKPDSNN